MIPATHKQVRETVHWYVKNNVPFLYEMQNETLTIKSSAGSYTTKTREYSIDEINFIKEVKGYIIKNELYSKLRHMYNPDKKVLYFAYHQNLKPRDVIDNCVNIDIESAYWNAAYNFGLLSNDIYTRGFQHRKQVRLSAIGSLAKKKRVYEYDGIKQRLVNIQKNENTFFIWDLICDYIGTVMTDLKYRCGDDFIFFWVDGIYVKKKAQKKVEAILNKRKFKYKSENLKSIEITERNTYVHLLTPKKRMKDKKEIEVWSLPFPFRTNKISTEFKGYNRDL